MTQKKGIYFTADALLASLLLISTMLILINNPFFDEKLEQKSFVSQDILTSLSELRINEINNSFISDEINGGNITNTNNTILEQIGEYWAKNQIDKAQILVEYILNNSFPEELGIQFTIGDKTLSLNNISTKNNIVTSQRMISGIEENKPLLGSSASAYLKKIKDKKTSSFLYYGGFVGQGNITQTLKLPSDYESSKLIEALMTFETPGTFELYINEVKCGTSYSGAPSTVRSWNISSCASDFQTNDNNITIKFTSGLNSSYISGGLIKTVYTTDTLNENITKGYKRYNFPVIDGFINLYDSMSAQGTIRNWSVNITFYNEYDTFLTVGNETVFIAPGSNTTQNVLFTKANESISPNQIPLRLGVINLSNITVLNQGKPSDSFLVTDVSGSMSSCALTENLTQEYCRYEYYMWWSWGWWIECPSPGTCNDNECGAWAWGDNTRNHQIFNQTGEQCTKTRLDIAKEADKLFVETILNESTLHQIGLVDYSSNANTPTGLTNVEAVLDNEIDTYIASGATCTCCGINRARDLVNLSANERFMIVLSDGEPTYYCSSFTDYTGSGTGGSSDPIDQQWAIDSADLACDNNITVYAIGFGDSMSAQGHNVMRQIACNDSLYFNATDASQLASIYQNISQQILVAANFTSQTINVIGNFTISKVFPDSYIDIYYDPINPASTQGKLSINLESSQFGGCNKSILIPDNLLIDDAFVTSFSSNHWTKFLKVNGLSVFNLTNYGSEYNLLGDPFTVQIPSAILIPGAYNNLTLEIGDSPDNTTECSSNNTFIYTALIDSSTSRTSALELAEGCDWTIETSSGNIIDVNVPNSYSGSNKCSYNSSNITYNSLDAYDVSVYDLMNQLDYNNDGTILVDIDKFDLEIIIITTGKIPYMWGPSIIRAEVWQ